MRETEEKVPKSRLLYKTEEAWQNAQESKRRYCRWYQQEHKQELQVKRNARQAAKRAIARRKRERIKARFDSVQEEFGKVVVKLNFEVGMSQEAIYDLLGGLVSFLDVVKICRLEQQRRDKVKSAKLKPKRNDKPN